MNKKTLAIAVPPGQSQFVYRGVEFRIAIFPNSAAMQWTIYGGDDGSVVVYKPDRDLWEALAPTRKNHDYWFVSIAKRGGRYFQPYVQQVILRAFHGPPPGPKSVGKHLNDNPSDNRAENLRWGTHSENAREAHGRRRRGSAPSNRRIQVPVRREVVERLRKVGPVRGRPFEDFVEQILVGYLDSIQNCRAPS